MRYFLIGLFTLSAAAPSFAFDGPCKEKRKAMRESRTALKACNQAWQESVRTDGVDPADDCAAKQAAVVANAKALKECRKEAKAKAAEKK